MKTNLFFSIFGAAAFSTAIATSVQAKPVDCWWGDPRTDRTMKHYNCDIRELQGAAHIEVTIPAIRKHFQIKFGQLAKSEAGGLVTWVVGDSTFAGYWQFDKDDDVQMGLKGYRTNFAFDTRGFVEREPDTRSAVSDTPFRF